MKKSYKVKKVNNIIKGQNTWEAVPKLDIECFPWDKNGYMPKTEVRMIYTEKAFHLNFKVYEEQIRATYLNMHDPVYRDSCVEFFFNPKPGSDTRYMNFEMNPLGTVLVGFGEVRSKRISIPDSYLPSFNINSSVKKNTVADYNGPFWTVEYTVPFKFIEAYYGSLDFKSGYRLAANFYKCGDDCERSHYGCWNPIDNPVPDFHLPQFFGELILE